MTRILVCGTVDDSEFVRTTLDEVDKDYGPITCVIHMDNPQALAWQQEASRTRVVKHMVILPDWKRDGRAATDRCRDRLFDAQPDYVVVFEMPARRETAEERKQRMDPTRKKGMYELINLRAASNGVEVLTYVYAPVPRAKAGPVVEAEADIVAAE
jgi:hypothetical protein